MFRKLVLLALVLSLNFFACAELLLAQAGSYWACYLKRQETTMLAKAKTKIFALADGALYAFSPSIIKGGETEDVTLYDKTKGLNDVGIAHIAYNKEGECLFVYYENGAIDLLRTNQTYYIDAIKEASDIRKKALRDIEMNGSKVYFSGEFGLSILDLSQNFIEGTFFRNKEVRSFTLGGASKQELYALVGKQIYQGKLSANLQDPSAWQELVLDDNTLEIKSLVFYQNQLLALASNGNLYVLEDNKTKAVTLSFKVHQLKQEGGMLYLKTEEGGLYALEDLKEERYKRIAQKDVLDVVGTYAKGTLQLLQKNNQISKFSLKHNQFELVKQVRIQTNSPFDNKYFDMQVRNGVLYSVNGGRNTNRLFNKGVVQTFDGIQWQNLSKDLPKFYDPVSVLPHYSGEKGYCYVGTWGEGLLVFRNGKVLKRYDATNSALVSALGAGRNDYVRVGSLTYDREQTLWTGLGGGVIASMTKAEKWQAYDYEGAKGTNSFAQHIALPNGVKWLADNHRGNNSEGVFAYDTKGTANKGDDVFAHYNSFLDRKGKVLSIGKIKAMALDNQGVLWLGGSIGYCSLLRPNRIPQANTLPHISRPIGGDEPPYYYVLDKTPVSAIAVDNLNRKWIGTENKGLYLVSADGLKVLEHYEAKNSPLLDDEISSLAFDRDRGVLYIGTNRGLNSLSLGTDPDSQSAKPSAIAYPNPLRPEDPDIITFDGLPAGAKILVFDTYGHQVLSTETFGVSYKWKPYQSNGTRLAEGVYFAHIYAPNGDEIQEIKLAIIGSNTFQ